MKKQLGGFTRQAVRLVIIATGLLLTDSRIFAGRPPAPKPPAYKVIQLGQFPAASVSGSGGPFINDAGTIAGFCDERGAFVIVPTDKDADGRPDTWFLDQNRDGVNDLQVYIHLPTEVSALSASWCNINRLNNAGQILGSFCYDISAAAPVWQGFVLTPRDINGDGRREWFLDDGIGHNQLIATFSARPVSSLNDKGQFLFEPNGEDNADRPTALVSPVDADGDGVNEQYFLDANNDGLNDLVVELALGSVQTPSNGVVPLLLSSCFLSNDGQLVGGCWQEVIEGQSTNWIYHGPFMVVPQENGAGEQVWCDDADSDEVNDLAFLLPSVEPAIAPPMVSDQNSSGSAVCGKAYVHFMLQKNDTLATRAVLWQIGADAVLDLGCPFTVFNRPWLDAFAVNDKLQVVGEIREQSPRTIRSLPFIPFLWQGGTMWDMNPVLGFSYDNRAWLADINNNGAIVGEFMPTGDSSVRIRFIAVPVP